MNENAGMPWTRQDNNRVTVMYMEQASLRCIAVQLGRTEHAIHCKLKSLAKLGMVVYKDPTALVEKTQQSIKKETKMNTTVTKRTYVGDVDASTLSTEDLLAIIEQEEKLMDRLNSIKSKTLKVKELLVKHRSNINALVELIG